MDLIRLVEGKAKLLRDDYCDRLGDCLPVCPTGAITFTDTLTLHLEHCDNLKEHKAVYVKYRQLDPKKRDAYYKKHGDAIEKYKAAKTYLDGVMNGKSPIPVKEWRKELLEKTAEKHALYDEFYNLRGDVRNVEILRQSA